MNKIYILGIAFIVIILIDFYAYQALKTVFSASSPLFLRGLRLFYFSLTALVLFALIFYNYGNPDGIAKHARTFLISFVFINVLAKVLLALFVFVDNLQRGVRWIAQKLSNPNQSVNDGYGISRSKFLATTGIIVAAAPIVSLSWGIISGAHDYRIRRVSIPIKGLPTKLDGLRIGQLSDIHSGSFWNKTAVKGGVEMMGVIDKKEAENLCVVRIY